MEENPGILSTELSIEPGQAGQSERDHETVMVSY